MRKKTLRFLNLPFNKLERTSNSNSGRTEGNWLSNLAQSIRKPVTSWKGFTLGLGLTACLGIAAMLLAPLPGLVVMGSLTVAMLLGIIWRSVANVPKAYTPGIQFSAKKLLRYGIILTGVRLNFGLVASSGLQVLLLDFILITCGIIFIPWVAGKLGLNRGLALLLGVGQSICGASAVGAIAPLSNEIDEDDVSLAVALCGLIGTAGVIFFSLASPLFGWHGNFYGLLSGSTLQEIAQVVAAGPVGGPAGADLAMVVKLTRVMFLAPVALVIAFWLTAKLGKGNNLAGRQVISFSKLPIPWFVFGFVFVGIINSTGLIGKELGNLILQASILLMVMAMSGMGLMVDLRVIRKRGLKALGVATIAFGGFIGVSYLLILVLGLI